MLLENYFAQRILERGYDYYHQQKVKNVVKTGKVYQGKVEGSQTYQVNIEMSSDMKIIHMTCQCPYAQKGKRCKHEAAMLIESIGEDDFQDKKEDNYRYSFNDDYEYETHRYQGHEILEKLELKSKNEILDMIAVALEQSEIYDVFLKLVEKDERYLTVKNQIYQKISSFYKMKKNDYLEITAAIEKFKDEKQYDSLNQLCQLAIERLLNVYQELSHDQQRFFFHMISFLEDCQSFEKNQIFFKELCVQYHRPIIYRLIDHLSNHDSLDSIIKNIEEKLNDRFINKEELFKKYVYMLFHYQSDDLQYAIKKYQNETLFYLYLNENYMEKGMLKEAKQICLQQIQKTDQIKFYQQLIIVYQRSHQKDKLIQTYTYLLYHKDPGNIKYYQQLKQLYDTNQWELQKSHIIQQLENKNINMIDIYLEEHMYTSLINYLSKQQDMIRIRKYEDILFQHNSQKMIKLYEQYIYQNLTHSNTRDYYRNIALYLKTIDKYDPQKAHDIYHKLEILYPNRHVMLEEMQFNLS